VKQQNCCDVVVRCLLPSLTPLAERQARVQQFQSSSSIPVFLLTSQVGGLGLTLTAADRVIM
jgi:SNF2 family DNA or RNA helicase